MHTINNGIDLASLASDPAMPPYLGRLLQREPVRRAGHVAVSGCRPPQGPEATASNLAVFRRIIEDVSSWAVALTGGATLVHGGADGVDVAAVDSLRAGAGHVDEQHRPRWAPPGTRNAQRQAWNRRAPMVRNAYVLTCERLVAWPAPWSRGTWGAVEQRLRAFGMDGLEVRLVGWRGPVPTALKGLVVTYVE